jgi:uncharacterized protein YcfL
MIIALVLIVFLLSSCGSGVSYLPLEEPNVVIETVEQEEQVTNPPETVICKKVITTKHKIICVKEKE